MTEIEGAHGHFPEGDDFLNLIESLAVAAAAETDGQRSRSGTRYPQTIQNLGAVLSLLYRAAVCHWGCRGGDHQAEWLVGRVCNQAMASYRLLRSGFYDESLMLTRGAGEIANLIWLFKDSSEFDQWRSASRSERKKRFGPAAVRGRLKLSVEIGAPITDERYRRLCEVGTHPVPWVGPNLFSGGTRPVLGHFVQPAGLLVATNELAYAVAMAAAAAPTCLGLKNPQASQLLKASRDLVASIGAVSIMEYEELLADEVKAQRTSQT